MYLVITNLCVTCEGIKRRGKNVLRVDSNPCESITLHVASSVFIGVDWVRFQSPYISLLKCCMCNPHTQGRPRKERVLSAFEPDELKLARAHHGQDADDTNK